MRETEPTSNKEERAEDSIKVTQPISNKVGYTPNIPNVKILV